MLIFDTIVIGKGLVGSAAAKYLSAVQKNIAVIGPDEPDNYNDAIVFASHYDQARVQRIIGKDAAWTRLNADSVKEYDTIKTQSGIAFHSPMGCLYVNPYGQDRYLKNASKIGQEFGLTFKYYNNAKAIVKDFNEFTFPSTAQGLLEESPAGFINPRLLLQAQLKIVAQNKGTIIKETVVSINFMHGLFLVTTFEKNIYQAKNILLATGSFLNFQNLLPKPLALQTKSETILLAKVSATTAKQLSNLPSLLYEIDTSQAEAIYLIQPVQYPDGNYYLKMGCNLPEDIYFKNLQQIQNWFKQGDSGQFADRLLQALKTILPKVTIENYFTKNCIISRTAHERPYIGETLQEGLYVAGGCNGYSAMCSDAIGSVAANFIIDGYVPNEYPKNAFNIVYEN